MPKLYLCKCYVMPSVIESFNKFYPPNYSALKMGEMALELLIANDAKFPNSIQDRLFVYRQENPYLVTVLAEPLTGNLSHTLRFIDLEFEEIGDIKEVMPKLNGQK